MDKEQFKKQADQELAATLYGDANRALMHLSGEYEYPDGTSEAEQKKRSVAAIDKLVKHVAHTCAFTCPRSCSGCPHVEPDFHDYNDSNDRKFDPVLVDGRNGCQLAEEFTGAVKALEEIHRSYLQHFAFPFDELDALRAKLVDAVTRYRTTAEYGLTLGEKLKSAQAKYSEVCRKLAVKPKPELTGMVPRTADDKQVIEHLTKLGEAF